MPPKITVNYEEHEDQLLPIRMIINFGRGKIQWEKSIYIPLETPFNRQLTEDYFDEVMSVTITQSDMILDPERPTHFGIYFPLVVDRIQKTIKAEQKNLFQYVENCEFDFSEVAQLIIYMSDIEEILQMDISPFYNWRD